MKETSVHVDNQLLIAWERCLSIFGIRMIDYSTCARITLQPWPPYHNKYCTYVSVHTEMRIHFQVMISLAYWVVGWRGSFNSILILAVKKKSLRPCRDPVLEWLSLRQLKLLRTPAEIVGAWPSRHFTLKLSHRFMCDTPTNKREERTVNEGSFANRMIGFDWRVSSVFSWPDQKDQKDQGSVRRRPSACWSNPPTKRSSPRRCPPLLHQIWHMISSRQSERCICCHVSGRLSHNINEQLTSHRLLWNLTSLNSQRSTSFSFGDLFAISYSADTIVPCCRCILALRENKSS